MDFNRLDIRQHYSNAGRVRKPKCFEEMKQMARKLSQGMPHVRVDFFEVDGKVYFGEFTFFSFSGFSPFTPDNWDKVFGDWLTLPEKNV